MSSIRWVRTLHLPWLFSQAVCVLAWSSSGGSASASGTRTSPAQSEGESGSPAQPELEHFSFFMTSYAALQRLSGSPDGFGGDLRYGQKDGLAGAEPAAGSGGGPRGVMGAPDPNNPTVCSGGGYGAIYCFALKP